jgi:hypothetical protein
MLAKRDAFRNSRAADQRICRGIARISAPPLSDALAYDSRPAEWVELHKGSRRNVTERASD